jgi:hypothetical protein
VSSVELRTPRRNLEDADQDKRKPRPKVNHVANRLGMGSK